MPDINKELAKDLQIARKKPRNFAIIAKGAQVLQLIVDKKPIREGTIAGAKRDTGGNLVIQGVVKPGEPPELVFQVLEEPTLSDAKLRSFIKDEAGLALKPRFEVVTELMVVDDDDDAEAETPEVSSEDASGEPVASGPSPPTSKPETQPPSRDGTAFFERLKRLKPDLDKVLASHVSVVTELKTRAGEMGVHARGSVFASAEQVLDQIEPLIRRGLAELENASDAAAVFTARLKNLMPAVKEALSGGAPTADVIKKLVTDAGVLAQQKNVDAAHALLDQVELRLKEHSKADSGDTKPKQSPALVRFQQIRLQWEQTRKNVRSELEKLEKAIVEQCREEDDFAEIASGTANLYKMLDTLDLRLCDKLDDALNADSPAKRRREESAALDVLDEYLNFVAEDPLLSEIDGNDFAGVKVRSALDTSLRQIARQLQ